MKLIEYVVHLTLNRFYFPSDLSALFLNDRPEEGKTCCDGRTVRKTCGLTFIWISGAVLTYSSVIKNRVILQIGQQIVYLSDVLM